MRRDEERISSVRAVLAREGCDAIACAQPRHVLMLTGYWPSIGNAWAIVSREGRVVVVAPEDELDLARRGFADDVVGFEAASPDRIERADVAVREPLRRALHLAGAKVVGYEHGASLEPASYVSTFRYGPAAIDLLAKMDVTMRPADAWLEELRLRKTRLEIGRIRVICDVARRAYEEAAASIHDGATEHDVVAALYTGFHHAVAEDARAVAFFYCMSGPNAFEAFRAYQRTRGRRLVRDDAVLVHCNAAIDGYWCDITRTYVLGGGELSERLGAIREASEAALARVRPGARASDVDAACHDELVALGYAGEIRHPTGHGVGFAAIDHHERPCIHPRGMDVLAPGMTFNVEPGLYAKGRFGMRRCDMVAVTDEGYELLTPF